jgi:hypothetical protein
MDRAIYHIRRLPLALGFEYYTHTKTYRAGSQLWKYATAERTTISDEFDVQHL